MASFLSRGAAGLAALAAVVLAGLSLLAPGCSEAPPSPQPAEETAVQAPAATDAGPAFEDLGASAGLDFVHFNGMSGELYMPEMMGGGGALLDYDGDGDLDVYLVQGRMLGPGKSLAEATLAPHGPLPLSDRLYRNDLAPGTGDALEPHLVDVTASSGIGAPAPGAAAGAPGYGMGAAAADFDNDGWIDLYVTELGPNRLLRNRGDGTFGDVTAAAGVADPGWSVSASFFDFDRDGWLDLYVANYLDFRFETTTVCFSPAGKRDYCGPTAYEPVVNSLFHNRGDGTFEDVSESSGIRGFAGSSLGVVAADLDGDGWIDLYVTNDKMENELWLNRGDGTFRNEALLAGLAVNADGKANASMGIDAGDCDGDGDEDLFLTHLTGESNTLYRQVAPGDFRDETRGGGLTVPSWPFTAFGTAFFDYDLDGRLDLFAVNGLVEIPDAREGEGAVFPLDQPNQLFRGLGGCAFEETTATAGAPFSLSEVSRGAAAGDLDLDGDPDLLVFNNAGSARLLRNLAGDGGSWLGLRLVGPPSGRDLLGARARVEAPGAPAQWLRVRSDGSYASAQDPRLSFGLGSAEAPATVDVLWPDGRRGRFEGVRAGIYTTLFHAAGTGG